MNSLQAQGSFLRATAKTGWYIQGNWMINIYFLDESLISLSFRDMSIVVRPIQMLSNESANGPELSSIYAAITTTAASEIANLERLETLGDSFLKFAASFYLFCTYAEDEGTLSAVSHVLFCSSVLCCTQLS
jgi:dsRNA-specific ribonuclease